MLLGKIIVHSLGAIEQDPLYHTDRYIYPIGYTVTRSHVSTVDANNDHVDYHCRIVKGDQGPNVCSHWIVILDDIL